MPYRLELAKSNRGTCAQTVCKKNGIKIGKDALKFGTWVEAGDRSFWNFKHWGCVSQRQLQSLKESITDDDELNYDLLDGYEDMGDDDRERVRQAISDGHVAEEDALGANKPSVQDDVLAEKELAKEVKKLSKNVEKAEKKADDDAVQQAQSTLATAQAKLDKLKKDIETKTHISQDSPGVAQPTQPKSKAKVKQVKAVAGDGPDDEAAAVKTKKRGRATKQDDDKMDDAGDPTPKKRRKATKATKAEQEEQEVEKVDDEEAVPAAKKSRKSSKVKQEDNDDKPSEEDEQQATKKRRKSAKPQKADTKEDTSVAPRRGTRKKT